MPSFNRYMLVIDLCTIIYFLDFEVYNDLILVVHFPVGQIYPRMNIYGRIDDSPLLFINLNCI